MKKRKLVLLVIMCSVFTMLCVGVITCKNQIESKACDYFKRISIKKCEVVLEKDSYDWTGEAITPEVSVVYNGETLIKDKDYTLNYNNSSNVNPGLAYFKIKGIGNYRGSRKEKFYINAINTPNEDQNDDVFSIDFTKVSPMIQENVSNDVVIAAKKVIESFMRYENSVEIIVSGNEQRFLNDMAYVIHCTCPMFGAFTDFNEMSSYNAVSRKVSWEFFVEKSEFDSKLNAFNDVVETYLSNIKSTDSETMRAMLLYYAVIDDLKYDYDLIGENYDDLSKKEANLKSSPYYVLVEKSGICTNIAQAYMFLCTQADIVCGTVLHRGGSGMHMWNIVKIDGKYYYCDPTWDANTSLKYFGITAADRASWAGEYSTDDGTMLSIKVLEKYQVSDSRFEMLRNKLPVEISEIKVDKELQTITFVGYEYEYVFKCKRS